jgi:hypothetical protein
MGLFFEICKKKYWRKAMDILGSWTDFLLALVSVAIIVALTEAWARRKGHCGECHGLGRVYVDSIHSNRCLSCGGSGYKR